MYLVYHTKIGNQIYNKLIKFYACSTSIQLIMMERLSCTMQHCLLARSNYGLQNFPKNIIGRNNEINFYINCKEWLPIYFFFEIYFLNIIVPNIVLYINIIINYPYTFLCDLGFMVLAPSFVEIESWTNLHTNLLIP